MVIYVNWQTHEILTEEKFWETIEEHVESYDDNERELFREWINDHYEASDVFEINASDIFDNWREYIEGIFYEEYEEIELDDGF